MGKKTFTNEHKVEGEQGNTTPHETKVLSLVEEAELDEVDFETLMEEIRVG